MSHCCDAAIQCRCFVLTDGCTFFTSFNNKFDNILKRQTCWMQFSPVFHGLTGIFLGNRLFFVVSSMKTGVWCSYSISAVV